MRGLFRHALLLVGMGAASGIIAWAVPFHEWPIFGMVWGTVGLVILGVLAWPLSAVFLHELAHGMAACLTGHRIYQICFWAPVRLTHLKVFGVWFACGQILKGGGYCVAYPLRRRESEPLLFPAAGPLMNLLLAVGAATAAGFCGTWTARWLAGAALVNTVYLVISILPRRTWIAGRAAMTDGALIRAALRKPTEKSRADQLLMFVWGLTVEGKTAEAEAVLREGRETFPGQPALDLFQAWLHWRSGKHPESLALFEACVQDPDLGLEAKAALALLHCIEGPLKNSDKADALSREVLDHPLCGPRGRLIRGTVLTSLGRSGEAKDLLDRAYDSLLDPQDRGYVTALKGIQSASEGRPEEAERFLRQAVFLGADRGAVRTLARTIRQLRKGVPASASISRSG